MSLLSFLRARAPRPNPGPYRVEWCDADAVADPPVAWHLVGAPALPDGARALAAAVPATLGRPTVLLRILGGGDPERAPLLAALDGGAPAALPAWRWGGSPAAARWAAGRTALSCWAAVPNAAWLVAALAPLLPRAAAVRVVAGAARAALPLAEGPLAARAVEAAERWARGEGAEADAARAAEASLRASQRGTEASRAACLAASFFAEPGDPARFVEAAVAALRANAAVAGAPEASLAHVVAHAHRHLVWGVRHEVPFGVVVRALLSAP